METIFSIHQVFRYKNHVIRAEKRSLFYTMEYSLIIDDIKQDQIKGLHHVTWTVLVTIKYDSGSVAYFID